MSTFGERLRQERESRNITLQEMSESTKIAQHCFKLLEDDDFANLPGGLYNRGYIRAYAQFIGLDPEHTIEIRLELHGGQLNLEIIDDARPFDPRRVKPPEKKGALKDLPLGGRGIHLVRSYVDDFAYQRKRGRNHVTVKKNL